MLGLCRYVGAAATDPLAFYSDALTIFQRAAYTEETAGTHGQLALAYGLLGLLDEAWRHRLAALESLNKISNPRRPVSILGRSGDAAAEAGEPLAALDFHDEAVAIATDRGSVLDRMVALLSRSRVRSELDDCVGAQEDLDAAWGNWNQLPDGGTKESGRAGS